MMRLFHCIPPLLFYLFLHLFLLWSIDLRDMPGAAGTEIIYKASIGERKGDITVLAIQWLSHYLDVGPQQAARFLSSITGFVQLLSLMLCGGAFSTQAAVVTGWIAACWSMSHYFPVLSGADPVCVSLAWLSVGLCWWGASRTHPIGALAVMCGVALAPLAVSIKEPTQPPTVPTKWFLGSFDPYHEWEMAVLPNWGRVRFVLYEGGAHPNEQEWSRLQKFS